MRTHPDDAGYPQQSELAVQRAPSTTQAPHASVCGDGMQCEEQHSVPTAQGPLFAHVVACSQRIDVPSGVHASELQHCALPVQSSPSLPQVAAAQRLTLLALATHEPEQQSASESQRSHCTVHPLIGAHRFGSFPVATHDRVAQSCGPAHTSPMTLFAGLPSFALHVCVSFTQRFDALQTPEQQSAPDAQISFTTRHASSSAQCPPEQSCPQHSALPLHVSPAGWQPGAFAHVPLLHVFEQQSEACVHLPPAVAHDDALVHVPLSPSGAKHESEQHAPAKEHVWPTPRHPVVGRHVLSENESSAHKPEQQSPEDPHRMPTGEHVVASASLASGGAASTPPSGLGVRTSSEAVSHPQRKPHDMKVPQVVRKRSRIKMSPTNRAWQRLPHRRHP